MKTIQALWHRRLFVSLSLTLPLVLSACSGGGGGDGDVPVYAGAWSGGVSLVANSCPRAIPEEFTFLSTLHNVDQSVSEGANGSRSMEVVLDDGVDTYVGLGELDSNGNGHSFSVTASAHLLPGFLDGYSCTEVIDFDYSAIDFTTDTAGFIQRHSSIKCTSGKKTITCDVTYTGSAYRTANPTVENSPAPQYSGV